MGDEPPNAGRDREGVSGLASDESYGGPVNESSLAFVGKSEPVDEVSAAPAHAHKTLPSRHIELRYWLAALALGVAIWAAVFLWLL